LGNGLQGAMQKKQCKRMSSDEIFTCAYRTVSVTDVMVVKIFGSGLLLRPYPQVCHLRLVTRAFPDGCRRAIEGSLDSLVLACTHTEPWAHGRRRVL